MVLFRGKDGAIVILVLIILGCVSFISVYHLQLSVLMIPERIQLRSPVNRLPNNATTDFGPTGGISINDERDSLDSGISNAKRASKVSDGGVYKPTCTKAVVVSLHRERGESDEPCEGLLIRDDIILTSRSCSRFSFTFNFPSGDNLTAVPSRSLNSNEITDSRLGFLKANLPYHYQFIHRTVRRNRVFLSLNDTSANGTHTAMSCFQDRPIAHNFPVNGQMIPLGHLHQVMPELLWEHTDIVSARGFILNEQRWWSRSVTPEEEKEMMMKLFEKYRGPPGSIDIVSAQKNYMDQASAVLEAEDPRGHRSYLCCRDYYYRYREEPLFSGENFFDWLDFGSVDNVLSKNEVGKRLHRMRGGGTLCLEKNDQTPIYYLNDRERLWYEVKWEMSDNGNDVIARYRKSGELVPKCRDAYHRHLYMWDLNETFYIVDESLFEDRYGGTLKHASILGADPALSAGEIYIGGNGTVFGINYVSGHYKPSSSHTAIMYEWFENQGLNRTSFHWVGGGGWRRKDCDKYDRMGINIPGYNATSLSRSCHEVMKSPTWITTQRAWKDFKKYLEELDASR